MSKRKNDSQIPSKAASLETRALLLRKLNITLDQLYNLYHTMAHPETEIYEEWTAKDILGHITLAQIMGRLQVAHQIIQENILSEN